MFLIQTFSPAVFLSTVTMTSVSTIFVLIVLDKKAREQNAYSFSLYFGILVSECKIVSFSKDIISLVLVYIRIDLARLGFKEDNLKLAC